MWQSKDIPDNPLEVLLEEVSLEGLDGITLEALWLRLETRENFNLKPLDEHWKSYFFDLLREHAEISAFELPEERESLQIFDFKEHIDQRTFLYVEPQEKLKDIYPYVAIHDEAEGVMGSCSNYYTRKDITQKIRLLSYKQVCETYKNELVFVASQELRKKFLLLTQGWTIPNNFDFAVQSYCILERIGRCRQYGCIDISKDAVKMAAKDIFYHRKLLLTQKMITKQSISKQKLKGIMRYNLYYLSRFHVEHKSKVNTFMEAILNNLKSAVSTNHVLPIKHFNFIFGTVSALSVKKLVQYFNLEHKVKELELPFSQAYPELPLKECFTVNKKEKRAICYQLLDPNINIEEELAKDFENVEDVGSEEEDEMEECKEESRDQEIAEVQSEKSWLGLVEAITDFDFVSDLSDNESLVSCEDQDYTSSSEEEFVEEIMDVSFLRNKGFKIDNDTPVELSFKKKLLKVVEEAGPKGCSALHVQKKLHLLRSEIRGLVKHNVKYLNTYLKDEGRQRTQYFRLNQYENVNSAIINTINSGSKPMTSPPPKKKIKLESLERKDVDTILQVDSKDINVYTEDEAESLDSLNFVNTVITEHHYSKTNSLSSIFSTELQCDRAQDITNFIDEMKVVVGYTPVFNNLVEKDKERQNPAKVDRKTAQKMLDKLVNQGYIKKFSIAFKIKDFEHTEKTIQVYATDNLEVDSEELNTLVQREKLKFSSIGHLSVSRISDQNIKIEPKFQNEVVNHENYLENEPKTEIEMNSNNFEKHENDNLKNADYDGEQALCPSEEQVGTKVFENVGITVDISVLRPAGKVVSDLQLLYPTALMCDRAVECYKFIEQNRITVGFKEVMNHVLEADEKRNYKAKVDHRTIKRILVKLSMNNFIKCFTLKYKNTKCNTKKEVLVYTVLDMNSEETDFTTVLEREQLTFWGEASTQSSKVKSATPSEYVSLPKFAKMEKIHNLIFYVTYSSAKPLPDQDLARKNLEKNANLMLPEDLPLIYNDKELDDFTFLPSLPTPHPFPEGFINFQDFIPLVPIRSLIECLRITDFGSELDTYYNDPVKRFYPMKDTSPNVFAMLTRQNIGRKNISSLYEILVNLAIIGLTQFGKRFGPEKENFALYVNKIASLRDTISSEPSYVKLNPEKLKPVICYRFQNLAIVKKYWLDSCHICTNTPLGMKTFAIGQEVRSYKKMIDKPIFSELSEHCDDINKILSRDSGNIPGDNLGAAGYDSVTFAHLKRNWSSTSKILKPIKVVKPNRVISKPSKLFRETVPKQEKKKTYVDRIVKPRKNAKVQKPKIIEKSSISLGSMRRMRTQLRWTDADSDILHLVKIIYKLFKVKPCNRLTRDVLVKVLQKSIDGSLTSKVLFSHYHRIMKMPENKERYLLLQAEVQYRKEVRNVLRSHIKTHLDMCRNNQKTEAHLYLIQKMPTIVEAVYNLIVVNQQSHENNVLPSNYDEFLSEYKMVDSKETLHDVYPPLNSNNNIKLNVLLNLIHSSLATIDPEEDDTIRHCLFDAYQRFSQSLIHKATRILRDYQIIAAQKCCINSSQNAKSKKRTPLAITRFKLNIKYVFKLSITEMQYSSIHGSYVLFKQWSKPEKSIVTIEHVDSACFNLLSVMLCEETVTIDIETPKTLLLLDPKIENLSEEYKDIVDRYYQLVDHYKVGTLHQSSNRNEDQDDEDDQDNIPPMNLFNAARLAMYTLKDVLIKEKISAQHIQRLLILNACKIQLGGVNSLQKSYECNAQDYIKKMSEELIVPALTQEQIDTALSSNFEKQLSEFIESKLELGATNDTIRVQFGATMQVKASLNSLIHKHVIIRAGNVTPVYVHNKYCSLWLLKVSPHPDSTTTVETQIAPWVHINSTINRPVLDYFLGVVLSYIMFNPGITLLSLEEHFVSVLQPVNIIGLLDVLLHIKCISAQALTIVKPTLFTKSSTSMSPATMLEPPECIYIEALPNAVLKLGVFIGDIQYEKTFLEHFSRNNLEDNEEGDSQQID